MVNATNNPELYNLIGGTFAYIITIFYGNDTTTNRRTQIAIPYNSDKYKIAMRVYGSEGFTAWKIPIPDSVDIIETNPTSSNTYRLPFRLNSTNNLGFNDGIRYATIEGTTTSEGYGTLYLGNSTAKGTAKNKQGRLLLYSSNQYYNYLFPSNTTLSKNITNYLPSKGGVLAIQDDVDSKLPLAGGELSGTLYTYSVRPRNDCEHNLGYTTVAYKNTYSDTYYVQYNGVSYGTLYRSSEGTTTSNGIGRLRLGNNITSGTAGNASGRIDIFGTDAGYTSITPSNNASDNVSVKLPSSGGTMPVASLSGTTLTLKW